MNQIPNIEDEKTGIEELDNLANIYGWHHEKCAGHSHFPSCPVVKLRRVLIKEQQTLHHQLQKARHDWLREEIVKLEGMKEDVVGDLEMNLNVKKLSKNKTLQIIINSYKTYLADL